LLTTKPTRGPVNRATPFTGDVPSTRSPMGCACRKARTVPTCTQRTSEPDGAGPSNACTTNLGRPQRVPRRTTRSKS
jgi:hypothetical protein